MQTLRQCFYPVHKIRHAENDHSMKSHTKTMLSVQNKTLRKYPVYKIRLAMSTILNQTLENNVQCIISEKQKILYKISENFQCI